MDRVDYGERVPHVTSEPQESEANPIRSIDASGSHSA
jgi:hypothetical protein